MSRKNISIKVKSKKRKYGIKSNYSLEALEEAVNKIHSGSMSHLDAAKHYKIPQVILYNKIKKSVKKPCYEHLTHSLTLSEEEEQEKERSEMACKVNTSRVNTNKRKYGVKSNYTSEALEEALTKIRSGAMTRLEASQHYKIPKVTLFYKMNNSHNKHWGKPITFKKEEEDKFTTHLLLLSNLGIMVCLFDIRLTVKHYLDSNKIVVQHFKENLPGYHWASQFVTRNPTLKGKIIHNLIAKRKRVTQEEIEYFFNKIATKVEGVPPTNIYNMDELGFCDNPKEKHMVFHRDSRYPDLIKKPIHSYRTVVFCANASGDIMPPFYIFKDTKKVSSGRSKLTKDWLSQAPPGSRMAVSKSGWVDTIIFEEWFEKHFIPYVEEQKGRKVLFCDTYSAHISPKTVCLGNEHNITFICFLPNSSSLLQPLSVGYFLALESAWRRVIDDYQQSINCTKTDLSKPLFANLIDRTLQHISYVSSEIVIIGFEKCGLHPFSPTTVLSKLPAHMSQNVVCKLLSKSYKTLIKNLRKEHFYANVETPYLQSSGEQEETIIYEERVKKEESENDEEIDKFFDVKNCTNNTPTKRKGRPFGSKNKKKKITDNFQENMYKDTTEVYKYINTKKATDYKIECEVNSENEQEIIKEYLDVSTSDEESIVFIIDRESW